MNVVVNRGDETLIREFFDLESIGILPDSPVTDNEEESIVQEFESSITFNKRYKIKLPWKLELIDNLKSNYGVAFKRLHNIVHKFEKNPWLFKEYKQTIESYLSEDLKQAFLNIEIAGEDRDATRFLWMEPSFDEGELRIFRFTRVLFGLTSSPFLLAATIKFHLKNYEKTYPETIKIIRESLYVDDVIGCEDNVDKAFSFSQEAIKIFEDAELLDQMERPNVCSPLKSSASVDNSRKSKGHSSPGRCSNRRSPEE
ncbi:uncharacterized protein [Parasteatoda tepidariorum]|uniref:uncharacterized protein n=1 Tax=Parasteatoda tepidariorum TaxID=114398 RepID=UPI0039BD2400